MSAQGPLVLGLELKGLGLMVWGQGLTKRQTLSKISIRKTHQIIECNRVPTSACPAATDFCFQSQSGASGVNTSHSHSHLRHIMSSDFKIVFEH